MKDEWNAQLRLNRLERDDSRLLSSWEITGGKPLALDSVVLQGADELNSQTIAQIVEGKNWTFSQQQFAH